MSIFKGVYGAVQIAIQRDAVCEAARDVDVKLHCRCQAWRFLRKTVLPSAESTADWTGWMSLPSSPERLSCE